MVMLAPDTVDLIVGGFSSLAILAPSIAFVVFSTKPSARASCLSLGLGYALFVYLFVSQPLLQKYAFIPGVIVACLTAIPSLLMNAMSGRQASNTEAAESTHTAK